MEGSGFVRPKNVWIRIHNTITSTSDVFLYVLTKKFFSLFLICSLSLFLDEQNLANHESPAAACLTRRPRHDGPRRTRHERHARWARPRQAGRHVPRRRRRHDGAGRRRPGPALPAGQHAGHAQSRRRHADGGGRLAGQRRPRDEQHGGHEQRPGVPAAGRGGRHPRTPGYAAPGMDTCTVTPVAGHAYRQFK
jgi:hypothetical protein